eukprot:Hpha_TRINITY_DN15629_c3_g8::TRINITY_DN15629_c3_g8_i1::g.99627::m.99627
MDCTSVALAQVRGGLGGRRLPLTLPTLPSALSLPALWRAVSLRLTPPLALTPLPALFPTLAALAALLPLLLLLLLPLAALPLGVDDSLHRCMALLQNHRRGRGRLHGTGARHSRGTPCRRAPHRWEILFRPAAELLGGAGALLFPRRSLRLALPALAGLSFPSLPLPALPSLTFTTLAAFLPLTVALLALLFPLLISRRPCLAVLGILAVQSLLRLRCSLRVSGRDRHLAAGLVHFNHRVEFLLHVTQHGAALPDEGTSGGRVEGKGHHEARQFRDARAEQVPCGAGALVRSADDNQVTVRAQLLHTGRPTRLLEQLIVAQQPTHGRGALELDCHQSVFDKERLDLRLRCYHLVPLTDEENLCLVALGHDTVTARLTAHLLKETRQALLLLGPLSLLLLFGGLFALLPLLALLRGLLLLLLRRRLLRLGRLLAGADQQAVQWGRVGDKDLLSDQILDQGFDQFFRLGNPVLWTNHVHVLVANVHEHTRLVLNRLRVLSPTPDDRAISDPRWESHVPGILRH